MILELLTIKYCMNKIQKNKIEKYTKNLSDPDDEKEKVSNTVMITVLIFAILSLILAIWGIVDAVKNCKKEDKVVGVILAIFIWPLYWILRLSGVFCKK